MTVFTEIVNMVSATAAGTDNVTAKTAKTLPQSCTMIRRIWIDAVPVGTAAPAKPVLGYVRVTSDDTVKQIAPCHLPLEPQAAYLGTTTGGMIAREPHRWVINAETRAGPTINFESVVDIAPNGAMELMITIEYSDGETFEGFPQLHYQIGKNATTGSIGSTSDDGTDAGVDIAVKGASLIVGLFAYAATTTVTADQAMALEANVTSNDFLVVGTHKFAINGISVTDATPSLAPVHGGVTVIMGDIPIKTENPTVSNTITARDAQSTGPTWNWGIIYVSK